MNLAKQCVLRLFDMAGYRLLRKASYQALLSNAGQSLRSDPLTSLPKALDPLRLAHSIGDTDFSRFLSGADGLCDFHPLRTLALYASVRYLTRAGIQGDVVDSGYGGTSTLTLIAAALKHFGDTSRHLALFDTTADPLHRADLELELWGTDRDVLTAARTWPRRQKTEPVPREIAATGYPIDKVSVRRYPREAIVHSKPIALLSLTSDTYESNRTAIATFLPCVAHGGVVAVESNSGDKTRQDAVEEFLHGEHLDLLLVRVMPNFRIGVKP